MIARAAELADIAHVVANLRAADRREIYAARFDETPEGLAQDLAAARKICIGFLALCDDANTPIALLAAALVAPARADVMMLSTDRWREIAFDATRFALRTAIPSFLDAPGVGVARAECKAWIGNVVACKWLEALGFAREGVLAHYGKNGEPFVQYARLNPALKDARQTAAATVAPSPLAPSERN
jgi:hypothetical protein